jgi:hypothetical protein
MKQYLLFAGRDDANLKGIHGFVGDFDSFADAFVALVDRQAPSEWWHVLDTKTGEVVERQHLKVHNGMVGFGRSHWVVGQTPEVETVITATPAPAITVSLPKAPDLNTLEADLRSAVVAGVKNGHANGAGTKANGHVNAAAADH